MRALLRLPALVSASVLLATAAHAGDLTVTIDATVFSNSNGGALAATVAGDPVVISFDTPTELPFSPAGQVIAPGDTYFFQVWCRDQDMGGGSSANFPDMVDATFP